MRLRHVGLFFLLLVMLVIVVANWQTISVPTTVNLLVGQVQAPLGLLMVFAVGILTVLYAILLVVAERRLLRENSQMHRELEGQRKRLAEGQTEEMRQLQQTLTREVSEFRAVLGRLVSQVSDLRVLVAGRVPAGSNEALGEHGNTDR